MINNYNKLKKKYGGYTPTIMNNTKIFNSKKKYKRRKKTIKKKPKFMINSNKYSPGTIIRNNDILYHLNNSKQWIKL